MPTYLAPDVYVEERSSGAKPVEGVSTSVAAFIGVTSRGPVGRATLVTNAAQFAKVFGPPIRVIPGVQQYYLAYAVQQFFAQGGTKGYVVRVVHYTDPDNAGTNQAVRAHADFDATAVDGSAVSAALRVEAINEGQWGQGLQVQVENASRFTVLLAEDVPAGATTSVKLVENADVQVGALLWIVQEVNGTVQSVDSTSGLITFQGILTNGGVDPLVSATINAGTTAFTPDLLLLTTTTTALTTGADGTPSTGVTLTSHTRLGGAGLKNGDVLTFAIHQALVVVTKVEAATTTGGARATQIEFASQTLAAALDHRYTRAHARDFNLVVQDSSGILETHEHLSLVSTNKADYVNDRLAQTSGASFYITATDQAASAMLMNNAAFAPLAGGNDGLSSLGVADFIGSELLRTGLHALDGVKDASILAIPEGSLAATPQRQMTQQAMAYCDRRRDLFYIVDHPTAQSSATEIKDFTDYQNAIGSSQYAAYYVPWIRITDPFTGRPLSVPPSGAIAGVYADTDVRRGVHKAPAGVDNGFLRVANALDRVITRGENDILYQTKVNVIRKLPEGIVVWGARTLSADAEWKYVNVRRLFIFLEQSIERGTQWVVFEPNDSTLWKSIIRNIAAFLRIQWREGKLVGDKESQAFFVKCDAETNPPEVVNAGQVITEIGVAPSKPAEFVVFRIRQFAGKAAA